jgi:membrane protein DedA with SNARE-associated domain
MTQRLIDFLIPYIETWGYLFIFLGAFLENSIFLGLIIPGETIMILGGFYAAQKALNIYQVIIISFVGGVLGGQAGYFLGLEGRKVFIKKYEKRFNIDLRFAQVEQFFKNHGPKTILFSRATAFLRAIAPFVAGSSKMPYKSFLFWDVLGAAIWSVTIPLVGYYFGQNWEVIIDNLGDFGLLLLLIIIIIIWINAKKKGINELLKGKVRKWIHFNKDTR